MLMTNIPIAAHYESGERAQEVIKISTSSETPDEMMHSYLVKEIRGFKKLREDLKQQFPKLL